MLPQPLIGNQIQSVNCNDLSPNQRTAGGLNAVATNRLQGNSPSIRAAQFRRDHWAYSTLLREPGLANGDPVIQAYQAGLAGTSLAATSNANEQLLVPDTAQAAMASSQIQQQSQSEVNHKAVLAIRLNNASLDSAEILQLQVIAALCETNGGKAVNIARGLLASEGIMIWDDPGCIGNTRTANVSDAEQSGKTPTLDAFCWPNPTDGKLFLKFSDNQIIGTIEVFDASGKRLLERKFESMAETLELDGSQWSQGLILVKVRLSDGRLFDWKVLLQR